MSKKVAFLTVAAVGVWLATKASSRRDDADLWTAATSAPDLR